MKAPLVSVAVISFNRLKYLRATLESMRRCIHYPSLQWIVLDGGSREAGLRSYLESLSWLDQLVIEDCSHAEAMNRAVQLARGDLLLLWPDDIQFTVEGEWLAGYAETLMKHREYGSLALNYVRRQTIQRVWGPVAKPTWLGQLSWIFHRTSDWPIVTSSNGWSCISYENTREGIIGSGIPSLTRTEVWRQLGPWKSGGGDGVIDSGGGEDEMLARFRGSGLCSLKRLHSIVPVAADIVDDDIGCKAKVRGGKRYGAYMSPADGTYYYKIVHEDMVKRRNLEPYPMDFEASVQPIGYKLPLDGAGNLLKGSVNRTVVREIL